ncbi:MAG: hypothetical protein OES84_04550 [Kiritimatiellaceae bacterium]|nr:hypothetical protein [Kiritimatiellaceae bacterium]
MDKNKELKELHPKGRILRLKQGYNPNSSSIGSMIYAVPVAMLSASIAFGAVSGVIYSAFNKRNEEDKTKADQTPEEPS